MKFFYTLLICSASLVFVSCDNDANHNETDHNENIYEVDDDTLLDHEEVLQRRRMQDSVDNDLSSEDINSQ